MPKRKDYWGKAFRRPTKNLGLSWFDWAASIACIAAIWAGFKHHNENQFTIALIIFIVLIYFVAMDYGYNEGSRSMQMRYEDALRQGDDLAAVVERLKVRRNQQETPDSD
jgi:hypothetical protein